MENTKLFVNKFQPIKLNDFYIDKDTINIINTLINMDSLNILLTGSYGCGKTSLLNSIITTYYDNIDPELYNDNILYINNLKEQGINYYRCDVKIFCQTRSLIKNKKKFVVLDDIDLINEQSQQVFRNCIDKYSNNVHFISSCSNTQKVIENLQSRFVIIKIKLIEQKYLYNIINKISSDENISIDEEVKEFIINISSNSIKIIINYMEKFKLLDKHITLNIANKVCTNINFVLFEKYTSLLKQNKLNDAIELFNDIYDKGYSVMDILDNYFLFIKITHLLTEDEKYKIIPYICKYIHIFYNIHEDEIELAFFTNNILTNVFSK